MYNETKTRVGVIVVSTKNEKLIIYPIPVGITVGSVLGMLLPASSIFFGLSVSARCAVFVIKNFIK